jgi:sugar/nucleoside kinase (ribokinase family)
MKVARQKGVETIINPAPAIPLPEEAYHGLGHLIVNETEAAILSGIEHPTNWNEVAAVFITRGVKNVIITLGGEVSMSSYIARKLLLKGNRASSTKQQNNKLHLKMAMSCRHARSK